MQRFVILHHQKSVVDESHWDVMLETDGVLRTWALVPPYDSRQPTQPFSVSAKRLPDHRLAYLDYEGDISGGRGTVKRIDTGTYTIVGGNTFQIEGTLFHGTLTLPEHEGTATFNV